jgi:hypothetical protein
VCAAARKKVKDIFLLLQKKPTNAAFVTKYKSNSGFALQRRANPVLG